MSDVLKFSVVTVLSGLVEALNEIRKGEQEAKANAIAENNLPGEFRASGAIDAYNVIIRAVAETIKDAMAKQAEEEAKKHPQDKNYMREAAKVIESKLPDNFGFLLLAAPFGDTEGRLLYTSTIERATAVALVKEWLLKAGAAEDWMKHIK